MKGLLENVRYAASEEVSFSMEELEVTCGLIEEHTL
jgi:hypothetical protein